LLVELPEVYPRKGEKEVPNYQLSDANEKQQPGNLPHYVQAVKKRLTGYDQGMQHQNK